MFHFLNKKPAKKKALVDVPVRPRISVARKKAKQLTGWSEFVRGYAIDTYRSKVQKREVFYQILAFRDQTLGIGAERPA